MRIKLNGEKLDTSAENTTLYNFAGKLSMYNYVYIDGEKAYARVFERSSNHELYERLAQEALDGKYPVHQNLASVLVDDRKAYENIALGDVRRMPNHVPVEWQKAY